MIDVSEYISNRMEQYGYTTIRVSNFSEYQQIFCIPYEHLGSSLGISVADLQTDTLGTEIQ